MCKSFISDDHNRSRNLTRQRVKAAVNHDNRLRWLIVLLLGLAATLLFSIQSLAQTISGVTASELETILEDAGLSPDMRTDSADGTPVAVGKIGDYTFIVRALNCSGTPKSCSELLFFANFPLGRQPTVRDLLALNEFNETQVFGRAYLLPNTGTSAEVGVDYVIELDGGVSEDHVSNNITRWGDVVAAFVERMSQTPATG